jgi:hypothetical protein
MSKINYLEKSNFTTSATPTAQKIDASDMNALKLAINALYDERGWGNYGDDAAASIALSTSETKLLINGLGSGTDESELPGGLSNVSSLWSTASNFISPEAIGDSYDIRIDLTISAKSGQANELTLQLDIGGNSGSSTVVVNEDTRSLNKTAPFKVSFTLPIYTLATFVTNGGQIWLKTDAGTATVTNRNIFIKRDYASIA